GWPLSSNSFQSRKPRTSPRPPKRVSSDLAGAPAPAQIPRSPGLPILPVIPLVFRLRLRIPVAAGVGRWGRTSIHGRSNGNGLHKRGRSSFLQAAGQVAYALFLAKKEARPLLSGGGCLLSAVRLLRRHP